MEAAFSAEMAAYNSAHYNVDYNDACSRVVHMINQAVHFGKFSVKTSVPQKDCQVVGDTFRAYGYRVYGNAALTDFDGNVEITIEWNFL